MYSIKIIGGASGKIINTFIINEDVIHNSRGKSLMNFLREQNVPVASSCQGQGVCQKCSVNGTLLSCQISLENFLKLSSNQVILIPYL